VRLSASLKKGKPKEPVPKGSFSLKKPLFFSDF